jgi:site-specific recombinase XerD
MQIFFLHTNIIVSVMQGEIHISIYLDTRRVKKNGKFPVKLRVFIPYPREQKFYTIPYEYTEDEFRDVWESKKPKKEHREDQIKLQAILSKANAVASSLEIFTTSEFENLLNSNKNINKKEISFYYSQYINKLKENNQISTASNYELSLKSLQSFCGKKEIPFQLITPSWLERYEKHMIESKNRSQTTVGIYLRPLKAIFNIAIEEKSIKLDSYPFGKKKYIIPAPKSVKKALNKSSLSILFKSTPKTIEQERAKDFWFFSYSCNGMNFKDIANLRVSNIVGDSLTFKRAKTSRSNKSQLTHSLPLHEHALKVIKKYGDMTGKPDDYVFSVINKSQSATEQHDKIKNFIRYVNQHLLQLAKDNGIDEKLSTYWARHSFATNAIIEGASMEFVSEALQHSSLNTTRGYFAGFENEKKKEISTKLIDF